MTEENNVKHGFVDFEELPAKKERITPGPQGPKDEWCKLEEGHNRLRLVTPLASYTAHKYRAPFDKGYGTKIKCTGTDDCPLCAIENARKAVLSERRQKAKRSLTPAEMEDLESAPKTEGYYAGVIERKTQRYKILDVGTQIKDGLKTLNDDPEWGSPLKYDVNITKTKANAPNVYTILSSIPKPLSEADLELKKKVDLEAIKKRCMPFTVSLAQKLLDDARKKANYTPKGQGSPAPAHVAPAQNIDEDAETAGEDEFTFTPATTA